MGLALLGLTRSAFFLAGPAVAGLIVITVGPGDTFSYNAEYFTRMLSGLGEALGFDVDTPWRKLPAKARKAILKALTMQVERRGFSFIEVLAECPTHLKLAPVAAEA